MGLFVKLYAAIVRKRIWNDPILRKHIKDADEIGKRIIKHIEKERKNDPELDQWMKDHPL
jgi:signal transduction protein with GAF and PtsI domain|tara:strand:- start:721 stop:900 length:180 start_codon:yes stop_codon:yes gene_type:complete